MALDDGIREFFDKIQTPDFSGVDWKQTTEGLRRAFFKASRAVEKDAPELADITTLSVGGGEGELKARMYTPLGAGIGPGPGIVFYHGGGFMLGDLDTHDMMCRRLAAGSRCRVISIDYRLSPENKFPAAHMDAEASWRWVVENAETLGMDNTRLAVAGDSAGGNLAAFISQEMNRVDGPRPVFQLLLYPLTQFVDIRGKKMKFQESGFFFSPNVFEFYRDGYIEDEADRMDVRVSPLFADDGVFKGLPPAHVVLCGWDPLHDEGQAYADKLAAQGVPVTQREHKGMVHGFMNLTVFSARIRDAIKDAGEITGKALGALD